MEIKQFEIEEVKLDDDTRTIEGWGSVFNNVDNGKDIVLPGAFVKSLAKRKPAMLWQHKSDMPLGTWIEAREDERGLYLKGRFSKTTAGNDAYELAKDKAINGLSIGYAVKQHEYDSSTNIRKLKELELYEVSLVTFPMNEKAKVTRVKHDGAFMTEREFEEHLRDVGLSQKEAMTVISKGYRSMLNCRDGGDANEQIAAICRLFNQINA